MFDLFSRKNVIQIAACITFFLNPVGYAGEEKPSPYACFAVSKQTESSQSNLPASAYWRSFGNEASHQCVVHLRQVRRAIINSDIRVIDVRSSEAYQRAHIPGSLNLPEYAIRAKAFLKREHLLLLNNGQSIKALADTCQRLKSDGYKKVSVLAGGIKAWINSGLSIDTDHGPLQTLDRISPRQLVQAQLGQPWVFVTSIEDVESVQKTLRNQNVYPNTIHASEFKALVKQLEVGPEFTWPVNIVVISAKGERTGIYPLQQAAFLPNPVFVLEGGITGYKAYLANHKVQLDKWASGPIVRKGCSG